MAMPPQRASRSSLLRSGSAARAAAIPRSGSAAPAAAVLGSTIAAIWLLSGVSPGEAARFVLFEALYVLLPGCLLYLLLSPAFEGWLRVIAVGWPCGYAIEIGAFALSAALHVRGALAFLPLAAVAVGGATLLSTRGRSRLGSARRGLRDLQEDDRGSELLLVAIVISAGLVLLALVFFTGNPLPWHARSISYFPDNVADISWAAEARNHWPITVPWVTGLSAHYYVGVFIHIAAVSQVTGVALSTVVLRLLPTTMIVVMSLQLWSISRPLSRSRWIGPLAVALFLIFADLNLDPTRPLAFAVYVFNTIPLSPTFALGAVFFLGLLALTQSWLTDAGSADSPSRLPWHRAPGRKDWSVVILLSVLILGGSIAKTSAIADFLGALGLYWLWRLVLARASRLLSYAVIVTVASFAATYLLILKGGMAGGLGVHPFDFMRNTVLQPVLFTHPTGWLSMGGHSVAWYPLLVLAVVGVSLCAFVPLLGAAWLVVKPRAVSDFTIFCVAVFLVGFVAYLVLGAPGSSQGYFLIYGYIAMVPLAAQGSLRLWQELPPHTRRMMVGACAGMLIAGLAIATSTLAMTGFGGTSWYVWYGVVYGAIGVAGVIAVLRLEPHLVPVTSSRAARVLACCIPLLCVLGVVKPISRAAPLAWKTIIHRQIAPADSSEQQGMTASLYQGLSWVRSHTSSCDVIAVNNHYSHVPRGVPSGPNDSDYTGYSAFTERRILLESWASTPGGEMGHNPYPERLALNDLAVVHGSEAALRTLAEDGVRYTLIDKTHGAGAAEPASVSQLVFDNSALMVYRLRTPLNTGRPRPGCGAVSGI